MNKESQRNQENPLTNILVNVLIPVLALSYLSKDPNFETNPKFWNIGPMKALFVALAFPIGYGLWFFIRNRKANFFSVLGLVSVLLTGGLTLYLWKEDGSVDPSAPILFGLKEASIPLVLGIAILASHWSSSPLLRVFLYNEQIFDLTRIVKKIDERSEQSNYKRLLLNCTYLFASSFLISTVLNFFLAQYFLGPEKVDYSAANARELYNAGVAKLTGWGFAVIGVPIMAILFFCMSYLLKGLRQLTGLSTEEILLPR